MSKQTKIVIMVVVFTLLFGAMIAASGAATSFKRPFRLWLVDIGGEVHILDGSLVECYENKVVIRSKYDSFVYVTTNRLSSRDNYYIKSEK